MGTKLHFPSQGRTPQAAARLTTMISSGESRTTRRADIGRRSYNSSVALRRNVSRKSGGALANLSLSKSEGGNALRR